jgi:maleamate amidohydrolase
MTQDAQTTYQKAGFEGSYRLGVRPVVLVVDLSRGFTDPECPLGSDLDAVVEANVKLLMAARAHDVPVIFSTIAFTDAEVDGGVWLQKVPTLATLKAGSKWTEIDPRLGVRSDEVVITKRFASAFFGSHLPTILARLHADTVIITGATTSGCVRASGIDSMQYGYPTLIPRECVGDRHNGPHEANLFDLDAKYADVVSLQNVLDYFGTLPPRGA